MPKVLTVKYDRSFPLPEKMREGFGVTLSLDHGDTFEGTMRLARRMVFAARYQAEAERRSAPDKESPQAKTEAAS